MFAKRTIFKASKSPIGSLKENYLSSRHLIQITLIVILSVAIVQGERPYFVNRVPNLTVTVGKGATLYCTVEKLGSYKVAWIHVDKQTILSIHNHVITNNPRFTVTHQGSRKWMLHLEDIQEEDRGYYMCQINTVPMISQVGYLDVVVPPQIVDERTSQDITVRENNDATLMCHSTGYPAPRIKWRRQDEREFMYNGNKVSTVDGSLLNISRVTRAHMGTYLCIASNGVPPSITRKIHVNVTFTPMIWVPNQLVGVPFGSDVTLECFTEAHPRSFNYWVRKDEMTIVASHKYESLLEENSFKTHMKLKIFNVQKEDLGSYRCKARNSLGETEGSVRIYEIEGMHYTTSSVDLHGEYFGSNDMIYSDSFSGSNKGGILYPTVEPLEGKKRANSVNKIGVSSLSWTMALTLINLLIFKHV
ncbi:Uncharacterised protein g5600 [Pycnogonum litorale]